MLVCPHSAQTCARIAHPLRFLPCLFLSTLFPFLAPPFLQCFQSTRSVRRGYNIKGDLATQGVFRGYLCLSRVHKPA